MSRNPLRNALLAALLIPAVFAPVFDPAFAAKPSKAAKAKTRAPKIAMKPEQVAELYARVALRQDLEAAKQLNAYSKPLYANNENAFDLEDLADTAGMEQQYEGFADGILADMPKVDKAKAKPALAAAIKRVNQLAAGAQCRGLSNTEQANEYVKNGRISEVELECTVPALSARMQDVLAKKGNPAKLKTKKLLEGLTEFDRLLDQAGSRVVPAKMTLYAPGKGQPWSTGSYNDIIETVHNGMYAEVAAD
ncbi:hypothetical protein [Lysobacter antibioticus]|uniref:hypothetical protein n=1 Tax=Lysobacter antibioticus TaxID=84531 RepID=UPI0004D011F9|nr:hypothetical protein [Lysobacter antibioticus]